MKLLLLIFSLSVYHVYGQLCNGQDILPATDVCPFPGGKTCCTPGFEEVVRDTLDFYRENYSPNCVEIIRGMLCAPCDPLARSNEMCRSYCQKMFIDCFEMGDDIIGESCDEYPETNCFDGFDFQPLPPRSICGQFGDPHIRLFSGESMTCKSEGEDNIIFKSDKLTIIAKNEVVSESTGATSTTQLTVQYEPGSINMVFNIGETTFPVPDVEHILSHEYFSGYTYTFNEIDTRLSIRMGQNDIFFTLSTPDEGEDNSMCKIGCPEEQINVMEISNVYMKRDEAESVCRDAGLEEGTFHFDACVYDVSVTGNIDYAASAKSYQGFEEEAVKEEEYRRVASTKPPKSPPTSSPPTSSPPASSSTLGRDVGMTLIVLVLIVMII